MRVLSLKQTLLRLDDIKEASKPFGSEWTSRGKSSSMVKRLPME